MIKTGKVIIGETPSEVSGKTSTTIKKGCVMCAGEDNRVKVLSRAQNDFQRTLDKSDIIREDTRLKR